MGTLYLHCGEYRDIPEGTQILGSLTATNAQMSQIGKDLRAPDGDEDRHVFSNCDHTAHGLRLAVRHGQIPLGRAFFVFRDETTTHTVGIGVDGDLTDCMTGFFDQASQDLLALF